MVQRRAMTTRSIGFASHPSGSVKTRRVALGKRSSRNEAHSTTKSRHDAPERALIPHGRRLIVTVVPVDWRQRFNCMSAFGVDRRDGDETSDGQITSCVIAGVTPSERSSTSLGETEHGRRTSRVPVNFLCRLARFGICGPRLSGPRSRTSPSNSETKYGNLANMGNGAPPSTPKFISSTSGGSTESTAADQLNSKDCAATEQYLLASWSATTENFNRRDAVDDRKAYQTSLALHGYRRADHGQSTSITTKQVLEWNLKIRRYCSQHKVHLEISKGPDRAGGTHNDLKIRGGVHDVGTSIAPCGRKAPGKHLSEAFRIASLLDRLEEHLDACILRWRRHRLPDRKRVRRYLSRRSVGRHRRGLGGPNISFRHSPGSCAFLQGSLASSRENDAPDAISKSCAVERVPDGKAQVTSHKPNGESAVDYAFVALTAHPNIAQVAGRTRRRGRRGIWLHVRIDKEPRVEGQEQKPPFHLASVGGKRRRKIKGVLCAYEDPGRGFSRTADQHESDAITLVLQKTGPGPDRMPVVRIHVGDSGIHSYERKFDFGGRVWAPSEARRRMEMAVVSSARAALSSCFRSS
uniref:Uncharacterized protein n=1 Tax=Mycena chlorophos TaxID=658473 RepID=A0ABQ0LGG9_MYCCL|nr:predicted protein [Mycena chlorophos]